MKVLKCRDCRSTVGCNKKGKEMICYNCEHQEECVPEEWTEDATVEESLCYFCLERRR